MLEYIVNVNIYGQRRVSTVAHSQISTKFVALSNENSGTAKSMLSIVHREIYFCEKKNSIPIGKSNPRFLIDTHTRAREIISQRFLITVNSTRKHFIVSFHLFARHAEYNAANNRVPRFSIALRHEKNMTRDTRSSFVTPYTCRHTFPHIQEGERGTGFPSSKLIS